MRRDEPAGRGDRTDRTHDLDFFTGTPGSVETARDEFETAARERG